MTDYKNYQQIIDLNGPRPSIRHTHKKSCDRVGKVKVQKRTKTGCLTCRKRKKKCDENIIDGKCQGCTRNFLDCNWPTSLTQAPTSRGRTSSISSECSGTSIDTLDNSEPNTRAPSPISNHFISSYPSPKSPKLEDEHDISCIKLPPLRINHPQSLMRQSLPQEIVLPKIEVPKMEAAKMEASKVDASKLHSLPMPPNMRSPLPMTSAGGNKFVITSLNDNKLCSLK